MKFIQQFIGIDRHRLVTVALLIVLALTEQVESDDAPREFAGASLTNTTAPWLTAVAVNHQDGIYQQGDTLEVTFTAEQDSHLYLLYHQADGSSLLLFPNIAAADNRVPARIRTVIPPPGLPPEQQYRFRVQPPLGREVLQVLSANQPIAELDQLAASSKQAAPVKPQLIDRLADRLATIPNEWTEHRVRIRTLPKRRDQQDSVDPDPHAVPSKPQQRVGLFIGIGTYAHPDILPTHEELGNSARIMRDLLVDQGKLDPERTKLLIDKQATRQAIEQQMMQWLPTVSEPGDLVFIYFSGHSGKFETDDPKEPDGFDEALAPYDCTAGDDSMPVERRQQLMRETSILDDTLARWLEELTGRQVVLILDTCFSGGVVGKAAQSSEPSGFDDTTTLQDLDLSSGLATNFGSGGATSLSFAAEAARVKDIAQLNSLVLTSCSVDEQSLFEGTPNKTMWFTYCLTEVIEKRNPEQMLTVQDAFAYASERMKQLLVEGNAERQQTPTMTDQIQLPVALIPAADP